MSIFNPKTRCRETFDPAKHAGLFICLWHRHTSKISQVIGPESTPNRASFNLLDENATLKCSWTDDQNNLPYIFTTEKEARAFESTI